MSPFSKIVKKQLSRSKIKVKIHRSMITFSLGHYNAYFYQVTSLSVGSFSVIMWTD